MSTYPAYKLDELGGLTMREYNDLLQQVTNMRNFKLGEKIEPRTPRDEAKLAEQQFERMQKRKKRRR